MKTGRPPDGPGAIGDAMLGLADRDSGATSKDFQALTGLNANLVGSHIQRLEYGKHLHRARRAGERLRFFARADARDRWLAAVPAGETVHTVARSKADRRKARKQQAESPRLVDVHQHLVSRARKPGGRILLPGSEANRPFTPGVTINRSDLQRTGELIITAATKHTVCPSPGCDPRYQVAPGTAVPPLFSSMPPGVYAAPASTWAEAALGGPV